MVVCTIPYIPYPPSPSAALRERGGRREPRLLGALSFVHGAVWRALFGRAADSLEKGDGAADEYMIVDEDHLMDRTVRGWRSAGAQAAKTARSRAGLPGETTDTPPARALL